MFEAATTPKSGLYIATTGFVGINSASPESQLHVQTNGTASKGVIVQGVTGQTANLQEWRDENGSIISFVNAAGRIGISTTTFGTVAKLAINATSAEDNAACVRVAAAAATNKPLVIQGYAAQSANLQEWQTSAGTAIARINSSGEFDFARGSGGYNFGAGGTALAALTTGKQNCAVGNSAGGFGLTTGESNTLVGFQAGANGNFTGSSFFGSQAGAACYGGSNSAFGQAAMYGQTNGTQNCAFGNAAGGGWASAAHSGGSSFGFTALANCSTGANNCAFGLSAGVQVTTGANNIFIGAGADLSSATQRSNAVAIGYNSRVDQADSCVIGAVGSTSLLLGLNTVTPGAQIHVIARTATTIGAIVKGASAQSANLQEWQTSAGTPIARINAAGEYDFVRGSGADNFAAGAVALRALTSGTNNCAVGAYALATANGSYNTAVGRAAAYAITGSENVAVGYSALAYAAAGSNNVAVGSTALSACTTNNNTAVGYRAAQNATSGSGLTAIGREAGSQVTTASQGVFLGYGADLSSSTQREEVMALGTGARVDQAYSAVIGRTGAQAPLVGLNTTTPRAQIDVTARAAATIGAIVQGATSQTANLQEWRDSGAAVLAFVTPTGLRVGPGSYAQIYIDTGATAFNIATGTTYATVTAFNAATGHNGAANDAGADKANNKITVTRVGVYEVNFNCSFTSDTNNVVFRMAAFLGSTEQGQIHGSSKFLVGTDQETLTGTGFITVASAPADITLRVRHDNGGTVAMTPVYASLTAKLIG
jgi:hypothetical protein